MRPRTVLPATVLIALLCPGAVPARAAGPLALGPGYRVRFGPTGAWLLESDHGPLLVNCGLRIWAKAGYRKQADARPAKPRPTPAPGRSFHGTLQIGPRPLPYWQTATRVANGLLVHYAVDATALGDADEVAAGFDLPVATFRAATCAVTGAPEPVALPDAKAAQPRLLEQDAAHALTVRRDGLALTVRRTPVGKIIVQDGRRWQRPYFQALVYARRAAGDPPGWRSVSFLLSVGKAPTGPVLAAIAPGKGELPCRDVHEAEVQCWARFENPFRPRDVRLWADVTSPSGRTFAAPGFFSRDHVRSHHDGAERLAPAGTARWHVRVTPTEPGMWRYVVRLATRQGATASKPIAFEALRARGTGFLVAPTRQTRYLERADGSPVFLIGHNYCWPPAKAMTYAADETLDAMSRCGINTTRLWLCSWGIHLEGARPDDYRLDHAWRLDHILRLARTNGLRVQLCLDNFTDLTAPERAAANPYLARNGGPCRRPSDFFTAPQARQQYQRRLRYLIARFAPYSSLLAWELCSELDYASVDRRDPALLAWARAAGAYLKAHDPYRHPVAVSLGLGSAWHALWKLKEIDLVQPHAYIHRPVFVPDPKELDAAAFVRHHAERLAAVAKPVLLGEFGFLGTADVNPLNDADKTGIHLHSALWAAAFTGCAGTPLSWWWDAYIRKNDLHYHYAALAKFLRGEPLPGPKWSFFHDSGKGAIRVLGCRSDTRALLWIQHRDNRWHRRLIGQRDPVALPAATVPLGRFVDGRYRIEWWDTYAGQPITHALVATRHNTLTLRVPPGQPDIACKVRRVAD